MTFSCVLVYKYWYWCLRIYGDNSYSQNGRSSNQLSASFDLVNIDVIQHLDRVRTSRVIVNRFAVESPA